MKKITLLVSFVMVGLFLVAADKIPERPSNIPEDAKWIKSANRWEYNDERSYFTENEIRWYGNGNLSLMFYNSDDKKYTVCEYYYENGKIKKREQSILSKYLTEKHKKFGGYERVGKVLSYYENGKVKDEQCYTLVIKNTYNIIKNISEDELVSVLCGTEILYDENGKEIKRIEHKEKCEYGCDEAPRFSVDQVIAKIKENNFKIQYDKYKSLPVVGKIVSSSSWSKELDVAYKEGFVLNIGDEACCLIDNAKVDFICIKNENGIGKYKLKEDKDKKFSSLVKEADVRFLRKSEIKNETFLKSGTKQVAGNIAVIGGIEFVYIPAGEALVYDKDKLIKTDNEVETVDGVKFVYSLSGQSIKFEKNNPKHMSIKKIKPFWLTKYEVTQGEYLKFCYETYNPEARNYVDGVFNNTYPADVDSRDGFADAYCTWFGKKYGFEGRLPEFEEWEYAARAGTTTDFYWGNEKPDDYCWYKKNSGNKMHPVGEKKPNAFGLYDMIGNAQEWCFSPSANNRYSEAFISIRGGSCKSSVEELNYNKIFHYYYDWEYYKTKEIPSPYKKVSKNVTGFRIVISAK